MQNVVYNKGNKLIGTGGEGAIFDPLAAGKEFAGGAMVGGILGAPTTAISMLQSRTGGVQGVSRNKTGMNFIPENRQQSNPALWNAAEETRAKAIPVQKGLDSLMQSVADEMGLPYENGSAKSANSIFDKVTRKNAAGNAYDIMDMKDHARTHLELDNWDRIPEVLSILRKKGVPFETEAKSTPWGYRGFHVTWRNADGFGSELQITTPEAWRVKKEADPYYDKWRNVIDPKKLSETEYAMFRADMKKSNELFSQLDFPDFEAYAAKSASDSTFALKNESSETGRDGTTHFPSINSRNAGLSGNGPLQTLPSSVRNTETMPSSMETSPFKDSISRVSENYNPQNGNFVPGLPHPDDIASGKFQYPKPTSTEPVQRVPPLALPAGEQAEISGREVGMDQATIDFAKRMEARFKHPVVFVKEGVTNRLIRNGYYDGNTGVIYINAASQNPKAQIFAHELTHSLEASRSYEKFANLIYQHMAESNVDIAAVEQEVQRRYTDAGRRMDDAATRHEVIAEYVESHLLTDEEAINSIVRKKPHWAVRHREKPVLLG